MKKFWLLFFFFFAFSSLEICFYFQSKANAQKKEIFDGKTNFFRILPGTFNCLLSKGNKSRVKSYLMSFYEVSDAI